MERNGKQNRMLRHSQVAYGLCAVRDLEHVSKHSTREPGDPAAGRWWLSVPRWQRVVGKNPVNWIFPAASTSIAKRAQSTTTGNPTMNGSRKSDKSVVPKKRSNKFAGALAKAETVVERDLAKENLV